jgi:hypothetical protein
MDRQPTNTVGPGLTVACRRDRQLPRVMVGGLEKATLVTELNGADSLPVPARFSHSQVQAPCTHAPLRLRVGPLSLIDSHCVCCGQGRRWVVVALFGMTVTGLLNLTAVLLSDETDLGGPYGIFYFYSYFVIFLMLGAYFWPLFIAHALVRGPLSCIFVCGRMRVYLYLSLSVVCPRPPACPLTRGGDPLSGRRTNSAGGYTGCFTRAWYSAR